MRRRPLHWLVVATLLCLAPSSIEAQDAADPVGQLRALVFEARYEEAITMAASALSASSLDARTRNQVMEVMAIAQLARRQGDEAQQTLTALFRRDPGHTVTDPDTSPMVLEAFARARTMRSEQVTVTMEHSVRTGSGPPVVRVRFTAGDDAVTEIRAYYRVQGSDRYSSLVMEVDGAEASEPLAVIPRQTEQRLELHLEARAPSGAVLATLGSAEEPLRATLQARRLSDGGADIDDGLLSSNGAVGEADGGGSSVAEEWWFWTLIIGVVAAGVVATVLVLDLQGPSIGDLGSLRLTN